MKAPTRTSDRIVKLAGNHVNISDSEVDALTTRECRDLIRSLSGELLRNRTEAASAILEPVAAVAAARTRKPPNPAIQAKAPARGRKR